MCAGDVGPGGAPRAGRVICKMAVFMTIINTDKEVTWGSRSTSFEVRTFGNFYR